MPDMRCVQLFLPLLFGVADAFFGFVFYIHGSNTSLFVKDIFEYDFAQSLVEFWLFSVVRTVILVGSTSALICTPQIDIKKRFKASRYVIKATRYVIGAISTVIIMFSVVKILVYTEYVDSNHDNDAWFWTSASWAIVASVIMYGLWMRILIVDLQPKHNGRQCGLESDEENGRQCGLESDEERGSCDDSDEHDDDDDEDDYETDESDISVSEGAADNAFLTSKRKLMREEKKHERGPSAFIRLLRMSARDWPFLLVAFVSLLGAVGGEVFLPLYIGRVIDSIVIDKDAPKFVESIVLMTILSIGVAIANGVRSSCFTMALARLNLRITTLLFDSILDQEVGFFDKTRTGAITSRLSSDTTIMGDTLSHNLNICLRSVFKIIGYTIFMVIISWRLTVVTLVSFPLLWVITDIFGSYYEKLACKVQNSLAKANCIAEEIISSMKTVRSFANESREKENYRSKQTITYRLRKKEAMALGFYMIGTSMCELLMSVATLFYGGHLVMNNFVSGGMLVSFILYQLELGGSLEDIGDVFTSLMKAAGASREVFQLIDREPLVKNDGHLEQTNFCGRLEFKDVTFAYPTRPSIPVLKNVSFTASPGEVLALVGPSGGGKSSCIGLLEHFYEPVSGEVLLDGINVKDYEHSYLHNKIALVGQEPVLYARSIRDNIVYGMEDCATHHVVEAARLANAHNFITLLKKRYETETGEKGIQLSGGQKQRVAIARALVRNPQMLLLDEATSALDSESEHVVQEALMKNFSNRTIVIVAHRLSTIEKADHIVVIDQGMVVEEGRHQELIKAGGLYAQLVQRQLLGVDNGQETKDRQKSGDRIDK